MIFHVNKISKRLVLRGFADLHSVLELEVNRCADRLVVSQHCGGYDRGAQDGAQMPGYVHKFIHYY